MPGIYIHIPFCKNRCFYCDFYTQILKNDEILNAYVNALLKELDLRKDYLGTKKIQTVFLGGGTPSVLKINQLQKIFKAIDKAFCLTQYNEITMEANPEDLTEEYLSLLREYTPVNRLSIGVQSFNDNELKFLNRKHNRKTALTALENSLKYFDNVSVDLIFGFANQTAETWKNTLITAVKSGARHISAYSLMIEEGSIFYVLMQKGKKLTLNEEKSFQLFELLLDIMKSNAFWHYEISNFALKGYYSWHNWGYWTGKKYLGLGASAHSFDGKSRQWNIANYKIYIQSLEKGIIPAEKEILSEKDKFNEYLLTRLRTFKGIDTKYVSEHFRNFWQQALPTVNRLLKQQLLQQKNNRIFLTTEGFYQSDAIIRELMAV